MNNRNTIQKRVILDVLKSNKTHPTASKLCQLVKEKYPNIGQATIYRNLKSMKENGDIIVIPSKNNINRYDGDISKHNHFICKKCGDVIDIYINEKHENKKIEKEYGFIVQDENIIYEGICKNCITNS